MTIAQTRQCSACKVSFVGLESEQLCPHCENDRDIYHASRRKGEPRDFLPYPRLLDEWRKRRAECKEWRKTNTAATAAIAAAQRLEKDNAALRLAVEQSAVDLAAEVVKLRAELEAERRMFTYWQRRAQTEQRTPAFSQILDGATFATIPPDILKRLNSLCHPDRWQDQPQERSATEVMQWLKIVVI